MLGKKQNSKKAESAMGKNPTDSLLPANFVDLIDSHSSYLPRLIQKFPDFYTSILGSSPEAVFAEIMSEIEAFDVCLAKKTEVMTFLRIKKAQISLLVAAADISNLWSLKQVTYALSDFADIAVKKAISFLLHEAAQAKMLESDNVEDSGLLVIAVGKLGGRELNYSSDVDLVVLFDAERAKYIGRSNVRQFFIRLTNDFVAIMQERTGDGYVFRVDLRLRPDPYSTPVAVSVQAARTYYENVGQNWERAAMIKARLICGDVISGASYKQFLASFVWRKYLDFAAINDIHSIKRQIDSSTNYSPESLLGYNIKLGKGGIREIEFFAQVQQLIWGGRVESLRMHATCDTLAELEKLGRIKKGASAELTNIYEFYRKIEHRLQMVADEHTHSLPESTDGMAEFASFLGYTQLDDFELQLRESIAKVQAYYAELFTDAPSLGAEGNLVFTGVSNDPETLVTIAKLGFAEPERVCEIVRGWHHGRRRSTRFKKVREILTELTPEILKYFARTGDPDVAFVKFDAFLSALPSGVQLFTLFNEKPELIEQVADLMGDSPWLAENFNRSPALVNRILSSNFDSAFSGRDQLRHDLNAAMSVAPDLDARLKVIRRWKHDMEFQIGIRLLKKNLSFREAGQHFSNVAEITINAVLQYVVAEEKEAEFEGEFVIVALGKLGARELTFGSDLDLIFVYESVAPDASQHYIKLAKRFTAIMSNLSSDGMLYKVDTRLRPQGEQGNLACSFTVFGKYYDSTAWNWELLALTKARVVCGNAALEEKIFRKIDAVIKTERDLAVLRKDVASMREKIALSFSAHNPWDLKYARGGLFELEFMIQYLILAYARENPEICEHDIGKFWHVLSAKSLLPLKRVHELEQAYSFLKLAEGAVRLTTKQGFDADKASQNQRGLIAEFFGEESFEAVQERLFATQTIVNENFKHMFGTE